MEMQSVETAARRGAAELSRRHFAERFVSNLLIVRNTYGARRSPELILSSDIDEAKLNEFGGIRNKATELLRQTNKRESTCVEAGAK